MIRTPRFLHPLPHHSGRKTLSLVKNAVLGSIASAVLFLVACSSSDSPYNSDSADIKYTSQPPVAVSEEHSSSAHFRINRLKPGDSAAVQGITAADRALVKETVARFPETDTSLIRANPLNTENYADIADNPVVLAAREPTSTFSIDVDTGAYSNVRRYVEQGQLPPTNAVRIEELINYFNYSYEIPESPAVPFTVTTEFAPSPWNNNRHLLHVGLQGYKPSTSGNARPDANLVFLLDVSGSMYSANKLGLVKSSIKMLGKQLGSRDSVSIVVYAGASGVVLEPTPGDRYPDIAYALDQLKAGGSTNGEAGIALAYQLAEKAYKKGGINRVILATDGDFNVGVANVETLKDMVARQRESGIALTTLGFGQGNYNDELMESLADIGNGSYAYIDGIQEARKVLVEELDSTLMTIAKDVKIQVEFNPANVSEYRLVGYVNRRLANEDFNNDKVDAGEIGAGHTVTALYEVALKGYGAEFNSPRRYATVADAVGAGLNTPELNVNREELLELRLRYKPVLDAEGNVLPESEAGTSRLLAKVIQKSDIVENIDDASESFRFSSAVAAFGYQLRHGKYTGNFSLSDTIALAENSRGDDKLGYRAAFLQLARLAQSLLPETASLKSISDSSRDNG